MSDELARAKRAWLEGHLEWAADLFGVKPIGRPVHGPRLRSVGVHVRDGEESAWLRVVYEDPEWGEGDYFEHNLAANEIRGVPKPVVTRWDEWDDKGRRMRGELFTYVPDRPLSDDMLLESAPPLPDAWLGELRSALGNLARHPMPRNGLDLDDVNHGMLAYFGVTVDSAAVTWTAAHNDLHWGNVNAPTLTILDWETWGRAPAGYDAATLYLTSLLDPNCQRIYQALAPLLETSTGHCAVLAAAVRLLRFVDGGEMTALARPLREHVRSLTDLP
jgi:hypothetical protein